LTFIENWQQLCEKIDIPSDAEIFSFIYIDRNIVIVQEDIIQSVLEERGRNRETNDIDEDKNEEDVCEEEQQKLCRLWKQWT
jgi:hypothetical protein